jgi:hypothetical protein
MIQKKLSRIKLSLPGYFFFAAMVSSLTLSALAFISNSVESTTDYFWVTGVLSSFLDNAPTYLVFLNSAMGSFGASIESDRTHFASAIQLLGEIMREPAFSPEEFEKGL